MFQLFTGAQARPTLSHIKSLPAPGACFHVAAIVMHTTGHNVTDRTLLCFIFVVGTL